MKIVTIGVYGFSDEEFFKKLVDAEVDTFCDIRLRRGMRGSLYSFVNSQALQNRLAGMSIRYHHYKELAPSQETRNKQKQDDQQEQVLKSTRTQLGNAFVEAYTAECLLPLDVEGFIQSLEASTKVIALFCVEREPNACHRSLLAEKLSRELGTSVEHLVP